MSGNTFGKLFRLTSCGESHGPALLGIVDGCPPGMPLQESDIQKDLDRRRPGASKFTSQRREPDRVRIVSGVFEGKTTGTSIGLVIENMDSRGKDYTDIKDKFRPGHADYTYMKKYGLRDYRGGGRASARETAIRVAGGAIAKKFLRERCGIEIDGCVIQIGPHCCNDLDWNEAKKNPFSFPDPDLLPVLEAYFKSLLREGDSCGALVRVQATGMMPGLGDPVFDRLDAVIAHAMMGINAVKSVGIGSGHDCVAQRGSTHRDEITAERFLSNHAGGILGGISTGQDVTVDVAFKPTSSIRLPGRTIDIHGHETEISVKGRHDPCVGLRAVPIVEAMLALVLLDHLLRHTGQNKITAGTG